MNSFRKLPDGTWGVSMLVRGEPGQTIPVQLANGSTKQVTLGEFLYARGDYSFFAVAQQARPAAQTVGNLSGIMRLFDTARQHLRFPAIVLDGFRLSIAGPRARVPGSLTVTSDDRDQDGQRAWYGRVQSHGEFEPSRDAPADLGDKLRRLAADPAGVAAEYGRLHGRCCFCNKALRDERSTAVGYGPDCADHYGLPWGTRPAQFAAAAA